MLPCQARAGRAAQVQLASAFDRARAAAEGSVTKALTLFAIAAADPHPRRSWTGAEQSGLIVRVRARPQRGSVVIGCTNPAGRALQQLKSTSSA